MTPDEYLQETLESQKLDEGELAELRENRDEVERLLRAHYASSTGTVRYAGSYTKRTMVREAYDLDLTFYFGRDDTSAGETLKEIYEDVCRVLSAEYIVERRRSALRLRARGLGSTHTPLRIDVVPGRFTDDSRGDVFLHQENGDRGRLKTNPQVHVGLIRDSGVREAIKLAKLWALDRDIGVKTFVLELLVVKCLARHSGRPLSEQLTLLFENFRDDPDGLSVTDPANSNNDLTPLLDEVRYDLSRCAQMSLEHIANGNWAGVFEPRSAQARRAGDLRSSLGRVAKSSPAVRPWLYLP
jgi:hypothetical protein